MKILVTGATGYIGGRLVPRLLERGHEVRCLARTPAKLDGTSWRSRVEVVEGDVLDDASMREALTGCDAAFYLVHSMDGGKDGFRDRDRRAATIFRDAAERAGVGRIVYLGGLGQDDLSEHLSSRQEVGESLADGPTPVSEIRAGVIIGSGSVSFEMVRYLTEVLPAMVTPRWVRTRCQPIAIADMLRILVTAIEEEGSASHVHEVGGPDQVTYAEMMQIYAEAAGLPRRWIVPVPVLTPKLSSHWVGLVTPLPTGVAKPLVESLRNEVIVDDNSYAESIAGPLLPYRDAVTRALGRSDQADVMTRWSGSGASSPALPRSGDPAWSGGTVLTDERTVATTADRDDVFWAFSRIGGDVGYYVMDWAWTLRGIVDALVGGVGRRRGRRHPEQLRRGEVLDFWRVADVVPGHRLDLYAEMKVPGEAWLSFEVLEDGPRRVLSQRAIFIPRGLVGRLYWLALMPFHAAIFGRMARRIAVVAESRPAPVAAPEGR